LDEILHQCAAAAGGGGGGGDNAIFNVLMVVKIQVVF
jgi:hypothetical protein